MMNTHLLISDILRHAARFHGGQEIVTRTVEGPIHRYTYADMAARTRQLANALVALGVGPGDRVATIGWNTHRHLEAFYAISGLGAVCHTINPRLSPDNMAYVVNDAEDVIKSGGEWISSIELENTAVGHPDVAQAAAIGISDERWGERPLLVVVPAGDQPPDVEELKSFIAEKVPKWWVPDQFEFVDELPIGATGKVLKRELRKNLEQK